MEDKNPVGENIHFFIPESFLKNNNRNRPRGKESTEVRITQNKGKERENSYQK